MVLLNELLEQAANLATQLAHQADEASGAIDALGERVETVTDRLSSESDEAHRQLQDLADKLGHAESGIETASQNATANLGELAGRAAAVQAEVEGLLASVKLRMDELEALKGQVSSRLEQDLESSGDEFEQLTKQIDALEDVVDQRLQAASSLVIAFQTAVSGARQEFMEAKGRLLAALEQVENAARDQTEAFVHGVDASLGESARALVDMGNQMLNAHNDAVVDLDHRFKEESQQWAAAALGPLEEAIEKLTHATENDLTTLAAAADAVGPKVEQAMQLIERSLAVLALARLIE